MKEFLAKRKALLIFSTAFLLVLAVNVILDFTSSETFLGSTWNALSEIKPMEYIIIALVWYSCAVHRPKDVWESSLITLNLSQSNSQK